MNSLWDIHIFLGLVPKESPCIYIYIKGPGNRNPWHVTVCFQKLCLGGGEMPGKYVAWQLHLVVAALCQAVCRPSMWQAIGRQLLALWKPAVHSRLRRELQIALKLLANHTFPFYNCYWRKYLALRLFVRPQWSCITLRQDLCTLPTAVAQVTFGCSH